MPSTWVLKLFQVFFFVATIYRAVGDDTLSSHLESVENSITEIPKLEDADYSTSADDFKLQYADFELKARLFTQSLRQELIAMMSNSTSFVSEIKRLSEKLPKQRTTKISIQGRLTCDCDGKRVTPCPAKCADSCFGQFEIGGIWRFENDCRTKHFFACQCYEGSSWICDAGISSCFKDNITGQIGDDDACSAYAVDDAKLVKSFLLVQDLLLEPIIVFTRRVESQSRFMKLAAASIGYLSNLTADVCSEDTTRPCTTLDSLKKQIGFFYGLKVNLTQEIIDKMDDFRYINDDINTLKEKLLTHVTGLIKGYACCLGFANFTSGGFDCPAIKAIDLTLPSNGTRPRRTNIYGSYEWVTSNGTIPEHAVVAGFDSDKVVLYAGRAVHEGSILPAKIKANTAHVSFVGKEIVKTEFQVLISKDTSWRPTDSNVQIPEGALQVGHDKEENVLYMGRVDHRGSKTPGKISSDGCLYIPYGYEEHKYCSYEILVLNKLNE
ncbi:hypothetical protein GE061_018553 [Apolygus lucorum]|uniref:Farnesoic acid O-methyl transferase domain-containing protein n=1 Tax=Apolygus lucorum TaxID=248454 RepID=A0A8S9XE84_APOLU|nr:hypothetical protein GE061_018553 [Apolygus lucorum]